MTVQRDSNICTWTLLEKDKVLTYADNTRIQRCRTYGSGRAGFEFEVPRRRSIALYTVHRLRHHRSQLLLQYSCCLRCIWLACHIQRLRQTQSSSVVTDAAMAQSSFLRQLREQLAQGDTTGHNTARPWQQRGDRHVAQDTLVCDIYDPSLLPTAFSSSATAASDTLSSLRRLSTSILSLLSPVLSSHLFHHSSFTLVPALTPAPHLTASLYFGDCVDDELLVSSLLLQLSGELAELCIAVEDDGGYFLLAEVADALPEWMSSEERLTNRVWLQGGQLRVIDEQLSPQPPATRVQAVQLLADEAKRGGQRIAVSQQLQEALKQRLADYPAGAVQRSRHYVRCLLPLLAVRVLQRDGSVVSGAANAFFTRDMIDMRTANKMQTFLPPSATNTTAASSSTSPSSSTSSPSLPRSLSHIVPYRVRLTRLLYAQLSSQPFTLPRSLLAHPSLSSYSSLPPSSPLSAALSLSYKLLAGLEMYYHNLVRRRTRHLQSQQQQAEQHAKRRADRQAKRDTWQRHRPLSEQEVEAELRKSEGGEEKRRRWVKYVANLKQLGWFTGVRRDEDEDKWRQRVMMGYAVFEEEEERRDDAERVERTERTELTVDEQRHLAVIEAVLDEARKESEEAVAAEVEHWAKWEELEADDSDQWMHSSVEGVEQMMAEKEEATKQSMSQLADEMDDDDEDVEDEESGVDEAALQQAQSIVAAMKGFMGTVSGYEGAEIPKAERVQQPSAVEVKTDAARTQKGKGKEEAAPRNESGDKVKRQQQLMRVLECGDEKRMMAEMSRYERLYGEGSFDRDLMGSAGELRLDDDDDDGDEADSKAAQSTSRRRAEDEVKGGKEEAEESEDEDEDEDNAGVDDEMGEDDDELLFGDERGSMRDYLTAMAKQLSGAGVGQDFERQAGRTQQDGSDEEDSGVDTDLNLLKNMLDSLTNQHGMAGPAGNLLGAMNVNTAMDASRRRGGQHKPTKASSSEAR